MGVKVGAKDPEVVDSSRCDIQGNGHKNWENDVVIVKKIRRKIEEPVGKAKLISTCIYDLIYQ